MTISIPDRQRGLRWRGILNAAPYIPSSSWREMTRCTFPRLDYGAEQPVVPRSRGTTDDVGITYPEDGYKGKKRLLAHSRGQRHRLYKQQGHPLDMDAMGQPALFYYRRSGDAIDDLWLELEADEEADWNEFFHLHHVENDTPKFRPLSATSYIIVRQPGYRMEELDTGLLTGVTRDTIYSMIINKDGSISLGEEVAFCERWNWNPQLRDEEDEYYSRQYQQFTQRYRCTRIAIWRDAKWDFDNNTIILPGSYEYVLRPLDNRESGTDPEVGTDHLEFEPADFYGIIHDHHECHFEPEFPSPVGAWPLSKEVSNYTDLGGITEDSIAGHLNIPIDDVEYREPESNVYYLQQVNTSPLDEAWFNGSPVTTLFGSSEEGVSMGFDLMVVAHVWEIHKITGAFVGDPDEGGNQEIVKTKGEILAKFVTGDVYLCV